MIPLLFTLLFAEMALIVIFVFKTPLRKLVIMGLDRMKRDRGPIIVKTVAGSLFVVMISTVYSLMMIQKRWIDDGDLNPTDQVLFARQLLETSLMGFSLFLALVIDRLHHYIRELRIRRMTLENEKKQNQVFEDGKIRVAKEIKALKEEMTALASKVKQLESELEAKTKDVNSAEVKKLALKKQSEGFLLEYDSLFEDNQNLRSQLQSLDQR